MSRSTFLAFLTFLASMSTGEATAGAKAPDSLTVVDMLTMTVDKLRSELQNRGLAPQGNTKPDLQAALCLLYTSPSPRD